MRMRGRADVNFDGRGRDGLASGSVVTSRARLSGAQLSGAQLSGDRMRSCATSPAGIRKRDEGRNPVRPHLAVFPV